MIRSASVAFVLIGLGIGVQACQESESGVPPDRTPPATPQALGIDKPVRLRYLCGNRFLIINANRFALRVKYAVQNTDEQGERPLPAAPAGDPPFSETELVTQNRGPVQLYVGGDLVDMLPNDSLSCDGIEGGSGPAVSFAVSGTSAVGQWTAPSSWPIVPVHLHLMRDGNVLAFGKVGAPYVWNTSTQAFTAVPVNSWVFCSGHTFLPDGRLLVAGGHISDDHGLPDANIFNPVNRQWTRAPAMRYGRWYPTTTALANGEVLSIAGRDQNGVTVQTPEVWTGSAWRELTSAKMTLPYYPRTFLAPNGRVFYAGELQATRYLNTSGTGSWTFVANRVQADREYGAAVMYEPGKILYVGGGRTTKTAEIIDLNQASPQWRATGSMAYARRHHNATLLPTGQVLVTGGTSGTTFNDPSSAVLPAEIWNPATGTWTTVASSAVPRAYHMTAVLLRDGRVLVGGSGDAAFEDGTETPAQRNAELYSPPYMFKGARPWITSGPATVNYTQTFDIGVGMTSPTTISQVTWIALGSTTHAFDMNQRFMRLNFTANANSTLLNVEAPANANLAPPGFYMLFVVNSAGVPSPGKIIRLF